MTTTSHGAGVRQRSLRKTDKVRKRDTHKRSADRRLKKLKTTTVSFQNALDVAKYNLHYLPMKCNTKVLWKISKHVSKFRL